MKIPHPSMETVHSKQMGICIPIPKTEIECQIFPARILFFHLGDKTPCHEIAFKIAGPTEKFLVKLNLLVGRIEVSFKDKKGFYSYFIESQKGSIVLTLDRSPLKGMEYFNGLQSTGKYSVLQRKKELILELVASRLNPPADFLELGTHKKLDWQQVLLRMDLSEIIPIWMRLGQFFTARSVKEFPGTLKFLQALELQIEKGERNQIAETLKILLQVGFQGILSPRIEDRYHQGIIEEIKSGNGQSALPLLTYGANLLRSLFIQEKGNEIFILPSLPQEFRVGRFYTLTKMNDEILYEWSNGKLKILSIHSKNNSKVLLRLPKEIKQARLRTHARDSGKRIFNGGELLLEKGKNIFLDRFEK